MVIIIIFISIRSNLLASLLHGWSDEWRHGVQCMMNGVTWDGKTKKKERKKKVTKKTGRKLKKERQQ